MRRILVHELASGLRGRALLPASLLREGRAMRDAIVADLARLDAVSVVVAATLPRRLETVDAVFLIAPETGGRLARLSRRVETAGVALLGCPSRTVAQASNKARLPALLKGAGILHPETHIAGSAAAAARHATRMGYPVVVKPARGAGSEGVRLVKRPADLARAFRAARRADAQVLVQAFVPGLAASVALVCGRGEARALAVSAQSVAPPAFRYAGGVSPLRHPLAARAAAAARRTCRALPGLRGFVGVDVVLADRQVFVIEVNPRLTTAYLGLRAAFDANLAGLVVALCDGRRPALPRARRRVRFTAAGAVAAA